MVKWSAVSSDEFWSMLKITNVHEGYLLVEQQGFKILPQMKQDENSGHNYISQKNLRTGETAFSAKWLEKER